MYLFSMEFNLTEAIEILEKTPSVLQSFLKNLSEDWLFNNEGEESWSPYDILGHLIHGDKTDWIARTKIILSEKGDKNFKPFDRFAQIENSKGKSIHQLLNEFTALRTKNIKELKSLQLKEDLLELKGIHPEFGSVTLKHLLATWVVHDLGHIAQISRVMAYQYKSEIGPWKSYLPIVK